MHNQYIIQMWVYAVNLSLTDVSICFAVMSLYITAMDYLHWASLDATLSDCARNISYLIMLHAIKLRENLRFEDWFSILVLM